MTEEAAIATIPTRGGAVGGVLATAAAVACVAMPAAPASAAPHSSAPYSSAPYSSAPYSSAPYSSAPYSSAPYSSAPYSSAGSSWIWDTTQTQLASVAWRIGADAVWSRGVTGKGVGVALIDTGIARVTGLTGKNIMDGPDLSFESQDATLQHLDKFGHGTHLAGIIAGQNSAATDGFSGIAPDVKLTSVKVGVSNGAVDVSQTIAAIDWVVQHRNDDPANPIRVINLAYGTDGVQDYKVDPMTFAVENAWRKGIVVVVAAGNGGVNAKLSDPAYDPFVLTVGAADTNNTTDMGDDRVASFSSRGTTSRPVDVVAPGRSIASLRAPGSMIDTLYAGARSGTRFFRGSGSSQAAAVTAGAVALMLQARPSLTPDQVKSLIRQSARVLPPVVALDNGVGMLNVWDAYQWTVPTATQTWTKSTGTGMLELSRGTVRVVDNGFSLCGEQSIFGPFDSVAWATATAAGKAWVGGDWMGNAATGAAYGTVNGFSTWAGRTWAGRSWAGRSWAGRSWAAGSWSGLTWEGFSW